MPDTYLPLIVNNNESAPANIVIDPITRIEGHLRIEAKVEDGVVTDAWSSSTMFRGLEIILKNHDPRDAWVFAQRICGVCTTVHAIVSVRAVENALGIQIPDNARLVRNLIEASQFVHDHVIHFYHLHALDWVDVVSALDANEVKTSDLQRSISNWQLSSPAYFAGVRDKLQTIVDSGHLGLFANGYWGHPAYQLSPEANLLAVAHYLEALDWQREYIKIHAILGGKNPHPQTYLVGGTALAIDPNSSKALNPQKITQLRNLLTQGLDFVTQVYLPDLILIAGQYKDWFETGEGVGNFLSFGDFPEGGDNDPADNWLPGGIIMNKDLSGPPLPVDETQIKEHVAHSWYSYSPGDQNGLHPSQGETTPNYTGPQPPYEHLNLDDKYSWLKAPRYNEIPMEVGSLARMLIAYAAGHQRVQQLVTQVLNSLSLPPSALYSTLGRVAARGIETQLIAEKMSEWLNQLETNMNTGQLVIHNKSLWDPTKWPSEAVGMGTTEAPRGALGHWVRIKNRKIANYQAVVPTTWNGSPRDANGQRGPWEEALVGTPMANPEQPLEILRTVHSFDPCMACSVHLIDTVGRETGVAAVTTHR